MRRTVWVLALMSCVLSLAAPKILYFYDSDVPGLSEFLREFQEIIPDISLVGPKSFQFSKLIGGEIGKVSEDPLGLISQIREQEGGGWNVYDAFLLISSSGDGNIVISVYNIFDPSDKFYTYHLEKRIPKDRAYDIIYNKIYYTARWNGKSFEVYTLPKLAFYKFYIYDEESMEFRGSRIVELKPGPANVYLPAADLGIPDPDKVVVLYRPLNALSRDVFEEQFPMDIPALSADIESDDSGVLTIRSFSPVELRLYREGHRIAEFPMESVHEIDPARYGFGEGELAVLELSSNGLDHVRLAYRIEKICPLVSVPGELRVSEGRLVIPAEGYDDAYLEIDGKRVRGNRERRGFTFEVGTVASKRAAKFVLENRRGCRRIFSVYLIPPIHREGAEVHKLNPVGKFRYLTCHRSGGRDIPAYVTIVYDERMRGVSTLMDFGGNKLIYGVGADGFRRFGEYEVYYSKSLTGGGFAVKIYRGDKKIFEVVRDGVLLDFRMAGGYLILNYSIRLQNHIEVFDESGKSLFEKTSRNPMVLLRTQKPMFSVGDSVCLLEEKKLLFFLSAGLEEVCRKLGTGDVVGYYEIDDGYRVVVIKDRGMSYVLKLLDVNWNFVNSWPFYGNFVDAAFDRMYGYIFGKGSFAILNMTTGDMIYNDDLGIGLMGKSLKGIYRLRKGEFESVKAIYASGSDIEIYKFEAGEVRKTDSFEGNYIDSLSCGGRVIILYKIEGEEGYRWLELDY